MVGASLSAFTNFWGCYFTFLVYADECSHPIPSMADFLFFTSIITEETEQFVQYISDVLWGNKLFCFVNHEHIFCAASA